MPLGTRVWGFGKVLLLAGALAATFMVFAAIAMRVAVRARQVTVPNLVGQSLADATTLASQLDLNLRIDPVKRPDPKVPAGHVLWQVGAMRDALSIMDQCMASYYGEEITY